MLPASLAMKSGVIVASILVCAIGSAFAQTTGGVFGPNISAGDRSAQFRLGLSPAETDGDARWEARVHYQQAFSDTLRGRIVLQGSDIETGVFESNFIQAELQWQFKQADVASSWSSALRVDARLVEEDDGASRLGVNWTNQWVPNENWQVNSVVLVATEVGSEARDGVFLELRNGIKYRTSKTVQIGLESFSAFGHSTSFGRFNTQNHRLGPVVTGKLTEDVSYLVGALFGASDAARDLDLRIWIGRKF